MFTGIVEELGEVAGMRRIGRNSLLEVKAARVCADAKAGDSIAVNGVCLTVFKKQNNVLGFEVMPQTLRASNLGSLRLKDKVNLERSLKVGDRVSGHFVYGHIDCLGTIRRKSFVRGNLCFNIAVPPGFISGVILRGSIAVDGISLTVQDKNSNAFSVFVIPHTRKNTTLGFRRASDRVNLELDKLGAPFLLST
ncbi:MAG: riboflavin synthase [Candidatus Omnitrophota bacterium]